LAAATFIDVDEVTHLAAILENPWRLALFQVERKIAATAEYGVSRGMPGP